MESKRIRPSDERKWSQIITKSQLLLPFYSTHSEARNFFRKKIKNADGQGFVLYLDKKVVGFVMVEKESVTNLLVSKTHSIHWQTLLLMIEKIVKETFKKEIVFQFTRPLPMPIQERFRSSGYCLKSEQKVVKKLTYHTALVLGGGGARGAYQIGVWQALNELGIAIDCITGTSVGALNGALILQDDFERAKKMWEEIETKQILSFPLPDTSGNNLRSLMSQIGSFTLQALKEQGVSTTPLKKLIKETFIEEKIENQSTDFYLVTTELPHLKEKVIDFHTCNKDQWQAWLLASASFFPAMAATKIDGQLFIDGGYRNNIPTDVAIKHGATECIIVDVKGPGVTKEITIPVSISTRFIRTPWSMGTLLLFDGQRSNQNIQLGYLETMKSFGKYSGYWYTIDVTDDQLQQFQRHFFNYLKETYSLQEFFSVSESEKICIGLYKLYQEEVYIENISLVLLELLAKNRIISATKVYTLDEFLLELVEINQVEQMRETEIGLLSVQEWLKKYYEDYFFLSEKQQISHITNLLNVNESEKKKRILFLMDKLPAQLLQVLMKEFLKNKE